MKNTFIKISGSFKRFQRRLRIFSTQNKTLIRYLFLSAVSIASIAVIVVMLSGSNLGLEMLFKTEPTPTPAPTAIPTPEPTATPIPHIYGDEPLVILDCSEFEDEGYILKIAQEFGALNNYETQYQKVSPDDFIELYNQMVADGNTPNLVIAPNSILLELEGFEDISRLKSEVLLNNAAAGAVYDDKFPIALEMYGYYFRVDLMYVMSHEVPREYNDLENLGERLRSDFAYDYLRYDEENEQLKDRKDEFLTSRYGFGFPGGDIGGELFISQAMTSVFEDGTNVMHEIKTMWDEIYLPPDTAYASDDVIINAYMNDALVGVYTTGRLYEKLYTNPNLFNATQTKPYLSRNAVYTANVIYCAVPQGENAEVSANFLSMLYNGGNLDKIIAQNHTAYLPVSYFVNSNSPWKDALNDESKMIYYEGDSFIAALNDVIMKNKDVEEALSDAN